MREIKPLGALSSGLLARKGFARPAMRSPLHHYPQDDGQAFAPVAGDPADDLGWDDMGEAPAPIAVDAFAGQTAADEARPVAIREAEIVPISAGVETPQPGDAPIAKPDVVIRQEAMARMIRVTAAARRPRGTALTEGRRAAFTLRVDAQRHLALRLACSLRGQSAQQLLIDALDDFLASLPSDALTRELSDFAAAPAPTADPDTTSQITDIQASDIQATAIQTGESET